MDNERAQSNRREERLPTVQVHYWADTDILQIHTGEINGDWETLGQGLAAYYDSEGEVSGFWIDGASSVLGSILDALSDSCEDRGAHDSASSAH